jgi:hypothetical protein
LKCLFTNTGRSLTSSKRTSVSANQAHNAAGFDQSSGVFGMTVLLPVSIDLRDTAFLLGL